MQVDETIHIEQSFVHTSVMTKGPARTAMYSHIFIFHFAQIGSGDGHQ